MTTQPEQSTAPSVTRRKSLVNRAQLRTLALDYASTTKFAYTGGQHPRFKRVSKAFLDDIEAQIDNIVRRKVDSAPSIGQTL